MNSAVCSCRIVHSLPSISSTKNVNLCRSKGTTIKSAAGNYRRRKHQQKQQPKYLRYPRRTNNIPPSYNNNGSVKHSKADIPLYKILQDNDKIQQLAVTVSEREVEEETDDMWEDKEIEAITSLFQGRIPQKPPTAAKSKTRERPLPLPLPHKTRPIGLPTVKRHVRTSSTPAVRSRFPLSKQVYKDPAFLLHLAREIRGLPEEGNVDSVLEKWSRFLRKGSLSMTIKELGHMGLPERALQTFSWAQKQAHLFPDDRILAAIVEILARSLGLPLKKYDFVGLASREVLEAMARGFIDKGKLNLAFNLLSDARKKNRTLDTSVYVRLMLEMVKNRDRDGYALNLLKKLSQRDNLDLNLLDCIGVMKVCIKLQKYDFVETLFEWFRQSGNNQPSVMMYTTVIHSRLLSGKYREGLVLVWEMEKLNCLFDLPAYRVAIRLFVALEDLPRAGRYFSRLKEAGFSPTYDIYRDMIHLYLRSGWYAKCKEVCKEAEMAGFVLDVQLSSQLVIAGIHG